MENDIYTLGIETSCDETSASVIKNGREIVSNVIFTQIDLHQTFGGVVPEIASRNHLLKIDEVVQSALKDIGIEKISEIAVTNGPGLVGALLVGVSYAKSLAYSLGVPLIDVQHIEGHIAASYLAHKELEPPFLCLVASGGHTHLIECVSYTEFRLVGRTLDDAAGEAYDKIARKLSLGYPGGPAIEKTAKLGSPIIKFPIAKMDGYDFSFSGLKSSVLNYLNTEEQHKREINIPDVCASFQQAVVDAMVETTVRAATDLEFDKVVFSGGVAANSYLREQLGKALNKQNIKLYYPPLKLCTDNAAMIACSGYYRARNGSFADIRLNADPNKSLNY